MAFFSKMKKKFRSLFGSDENNVLEKTDRSTDLVKVSKDIIKIEDHG